MEKFLENTPQARERSAKDRCIAHLLQQDHVGLGLISKEVLTNVVTEALSLDRSWRSILEKRIDLRGDDYKDKVKLEEKAKEELGYYQSIRQPFNG